MNSWAPAVRAAVSMTLRVLGDGFTLEEFPIEVPVAVDDVLANRSREHIRVLLDGADLFPELPEMIPSTRIVPSSTSYSRRSNLSSVDFPPPLVPASPMVVPAGTERSTDERTSSLVEYLNSTASNSTCPSMSSGTMPSAEESIDGLWPRMPNTRSALAFAF